MTMKQNNRIHLLLTMVIVYITGTQASAPVRYVSQPVLRNTAQIMQGEVATQVSASTPTAGPVTPGTPLIVNHFTVANYQETGQYGPSGESSVGSQQLLVASKGRIRSFLKNGMLDNVLNLTHDSFFSAISLGGFTADPNVLFHPIWKQWILFADAPTPFSSTLLLAISDSDPITPATVWSFYVVDQVSNNPAFTATTFLDYTTLGADAQAVYCAVNVIDTNIAGPNSFVSAAAYVIPKSTLSQTAPATVYAWRNTVANTLKPFTFQPSLNFDQNPTAGYFPSIDWNEALTNSVSHFLVNIVTFDAQNVPTLSEPIEIPIIPFFPPLTVNVLGTPLSHPVSPVAGFRLAPSHVRNNALWLANNIGVDNNGKSNINLPPCTPPTGTITRDAVRFTQIDVTKLSSSPTSSVVSQGTLFQPTSTNNLGERSFLTPSIMSQANGTVLIGATTCGATERLNAAVAQLTANNTAVGTPVLYTQSTSNYYATEDWEFVPFARWGDHTRVSPDPENSQAFWTSQQWCSAENTWALEAAQILAN